MRDVIVGLVALQSFAQPGEEARSPVLTRIDVPPAAAAAWSCADAMSVAEIGTREDRKALSEYVTARWHIAAKREGGTLLRVVSEAGAVQLVEQSVAVCTDLPDTVRFGRAIEAMIDATSSRYRAP